MFPTGRKWDITKEQRRLEATTPTPLLVLDRPGTSPENMALRALLEKLDDKISSRQLRSEWRTQNSATTVLSLI